MNTQSPPVDIHRRPPDPTAPPQHIPAGVNLELTSMVARLNSEVELASHGRAARKVESADAMACGRRFQHIEAACQYPLHPP